VNAGKEKRDFTRANMPVLLFSSMLPEKKEKKDLSVQEDFAAGPTHTSGTPSPHAKETFKKGWDSKKESKRKDQRPCPFSLPTRTGGSHFGRK
jgi:hypothetical protein